MVNVLRRGFLKCCVGSAAAFWLDFSILGTLEKVLAAVGVPLAPSYPISKVVRTTLERTVNPSDSPPGSFPPQRPYVPTIPPSDISEYAANSYGKWKYVSRRGDVVGVPYLCPDMRDPFQNPPDIGPSVTDPSRCATLLTFFTMSDVHIADKESPARCNFFGYKYPEIPGGSSAAYSGVILYTTQVLDAAVQTINALHKKTPFDFGVALGDAADNTQHNELRWYIDVLDGRMIHPSSGAHLGADSIDYQKPYQAAGLDKSIKWYQAVGNHDQNWMGAALVNGYVRKTLVGPHVLNIGMSPDFKTILNTRGYYMGVVDGRTEYGTIIDAGPVYTPAPTVAADPDRRSLTISQWMSQFFNTTSQPAGHGFTREMIAQGFACYHFYPKAGIPIKVIVLDDTDKTGGPNGALDSKRYKWLINELEEGQAADELMIICAHVPVAPYAQQSGPEAWSLWTPDSPVTEEELLETLHKYPNLALWIAGHAHRNTITPQPSPANPEHGFWVVETPSLRDFPQQFRRIQIVRNNDGNISTFVLSVDHASAPLADGAVSPALKSRQCAIAAQQIFANPAQQGPGMDPSSCVYNAELVTQLSQLSPGLRKKITSISPLVSAFKINDGAVSTVGRNVTLNNTVAGATPTHYMASEFPTFKGAAWKIYSKAPSFTLGPTDGSGGKTVYFKVKDGSGKQSAVVKDSIRG